MAQLRPTVQKLFRAVPNMALRSAANQDVQTFLEATTSTSIERALTEFSARICYNSVRKMGSSANFVEKILQSGHLSTAEHASLMVPAGAVGKTKNVLFEHNRFFDFPKGFVAGNMRSWLEYMAISGYMPVYEYIVAIFPDVFPGTSYLDPKELYEFSEEAPVSVPVFEKGLDGQFNLYLLAVNMGELGVSRRTETKLDTPWVRYTWLIEGVSRSLTHQLVRHRGASFSQESQRYVDFEKGSADKNYGPFIYSEGLTVAQENLLFEAYRDDVIKYQDLRKLGLKKEDARFVLPNAASTRLVCSFSTRELLHFLSIRCAKDAQWEIRRLAVQMLRQAYMATPIKEYQELLDKFDIEV